MNNDRRSTRPWNSSACKRAGGSGESTAQRGGLCATKSIGPGLGSAVRRRESDSAETWRSKNYRDLDRERDWKRGGEAIFWGAEIARSPCTPHFGSRGGVSGSTSFWPAPGVF
jgi:hypothetical protein